MKIKALFLFLLLPIFSYSQLRINELMSNNISALMDETNNYSMWVEIYNAGSTSVNLSWYYFTEDLSQPKMWKPASREIAPKGYGILWFERDDKIGHATFKLEPEGGNLFLFDESGKEIDKVSYPSQYRNISYGRKADNHSEWAFFENHTAGYSNSSKPWASKHCGTPSFNLKSGFYSSSQQLTFASPEPGDTIFYSLDNSEPTRKSFSYKSGSKINIAATTCVRAKTISYGKLSSAIVTSTYFINERDFNLPVISITTENKNLTDDMIGIYVDGKNGIIGRGSTVPVNFNQDWDRPANFELFDVNKLSKLNQELDIGILGGWSRRKPLKSLKISPDKKYGDGRLRYGIFDAIKPGMEYKAIQIRNSGQDFESTMMRDGFMQSIVQKQMDLDFLAYEPAILFINGKYYGIENLRERTNEDYLFSNYGLEEEDFYLMEGGKIQNDPSYLPLSNYITQNDITQDAVLEEVGKMMDIENYTNYVISEIFFGNNDWPSNNTKAWKKRVDGKWRWILYDTDQGFALSPANLHYNSLTYALGENPAKIPAAWSTLLLRRLTSNKTYLDKFIDRFSIHLSSTFQPDRINHIMDSLSNKIEKEIIFHKQLYNNLRVFTNEIGIMKAFTACRADDMLKFIGARFLNNAGLKTIQLSADINRNLFTLNSEPIRGSNIALKYFKNRKFEIKANPVPGYRFKEWKLTSIDSINLMPQGSFWKYYDKNGIPAANWHQSAYDDALWTSGKAPLGYGGKGEATVIGYGGNPNARYITAYFRSNFNISKLDKKDNFSLDLFVDDGAVVYVNGVVVGRFNLPVVTIGFETLASVSLDKTKVTFNVPKEILKEGQNLIAVEVHQILANNNDLTFDMQIYCDSEISSEIISGNTYSGTLTKSFRLKAYYQESSTNETEKIPVMINELVAANTNISDEFGGYDDYLELYNCGTTDVNIAGFYLSDTPTNLTLSQIPSTDATKTTIPAKGRIILWADSQAGQGALHLGFKLAKEGETIYLSKKNAFGELIKVDSVSYSSLADNVSFSRIDDGNTKWAIKPPTFNKPNGLVSVTAESFKDIRLYPTVIGSSFRILNAVEEQILIVDLNGRVFFNETCSRQDELIQAGFLQKGLYIVKIGSKTFKVVKL